MDGLQADLQSHYRRILMVMKRNNSRPLVVMNMEVRIVTSLLHLPQTLTIILSKMHHLHIK
jgi:hypothetical protein